MQRGIRNLALKPRLLCSATPNPKPKAPLTSQGPVAIAQQVARWRRLGCRVFELVEGFRVQGLGLRVWGRRELPDPMPWTGKSPDPKPPSRKTLAVRASNMHPVEPSSSSVKRQENSTAAFLHRGSGFRIRRGWGSGPRGVATVLQA